MEIIGTIKTVLPAQSGTSKQGNAYTSQTIVITYGEQYPKELALTLLTRQVETYGSYLTPGLRLKFSFDASSREYNGRYYTECVIWKIESLAPKPSAQPFQPAPSAQPFQPAPQAAAAPTPIPQYGPQYGQQLSAPAPIEGYSPNNNPLPF